MSSQQKTIVVVGATGKQGGSVARTFLTLPGWHVRAVTRDPASNASQVLAAAGAEIVRADLGDLASLKAAFAGAQAIFLNTDFWAVYYPVKSALQAGNLDLDNAAHAAFSAEIHNGMRAVEAAASTEGLERLVVSSLASTSKGSGGKYTLALHTEAKAWILDYAMREFPELASKLSAIYLGAYKDNPLLSPKAGPGPSELSIVLPFHTDTRLPIIDQEESTGPFVRALIEDEEPGVHLLAYDSHLTANQIANAWLEASGKETVLILMSSQEISKRTGALREHLDAVDQIVEFGYCAAVVGLIEPHQLKNPPKTRTWEDWLKSRSRNQLLS